MYKIFILSLFILSCNLYELAGGEQKISNEFDILVNQKFLFADEFPFYDYGVHSTVEPYTFVYSNISDQDVFISSLYITGSAVFAISADTCSGGTLTPSTSCSINVDFSPSGSSGDEFFGELNLDYDVSGFFRSYKINIKGTTL